MSGKRNLLCWTNVDVGSYSVQWRIENYSYLKMEKGEAITSPAFVAGKNQVEWCLHLFPEGSDDEDEDDLESDEPDEDVFVSVNLDLKSEVQITAFYKISLLNKIKEKFREIEGGCPFLGPTDKRFPRFIKKTVLLHKENGLLENDSLMVNLELELVENISNSSFTPPIISKNLNQMSEDYLNLLNSSVMSDFIINVKSRRFNVHKLILTARSPVFAAMISHDLQESRTNVLNIEDVDPDVMECVIQYIYSGKCHKLEEMAKEILPVADKYALDHLKIMCEEVLSSQLNLGNIVSIVCLADMYSAQKLKEKSIDFISGNFKNVLESPDWKNMVSMNKDLALEIWPAVVNKNIIVKQIRLN